jgi:hypothetical protein
MAGYSPVITGVPMILVYPITSGMPSAASVTPAMMSAPIRRRSSGWMSWSSGGLHLKLDSPARRCKPEGVIPIHRSLAACAPLETIHHRPPLRKAVVTAQRG